MWKNRLDNFVALRRPAAVESEDSAAVVVEPSPISPAAWDAFLKNSTSARDVHQMAVDFVATNLPRGLHLP